MVKEQLRQLPKAGWAVEDCSRGESPAVESLLDEWTISLPGKGGIVDVSAGPGYEARYLAERGYEVEALDPLPVVWEQVYPVLQSDLGAMRYHTASKSGILLKDTIVFLDDEDRLELLLEGWRVLKPGGSLLIMTQVSSVDVAHFYDGRWVWSMTSADCAGRGQWVEQVLSEHQRGTIVVAVEYQTTPRSLARFSENIGFRVNRQHEYSWNEPLAKENRWVQQAGFVLDLRKAI